MLHIDELVNCVVKGDVDRAVKLTQEILEAKTPVKEILDKALVPAMDIVGDQFAKSEIFFPELLMAGEAMEEALEVLKPQLSKGKDVYIGKYVIGTVQGDVHDIGKNIVIMMLEGNGWEVTDLGIDVPPQQFCEAIAQGDYDILGIGAYVSLSIPQLETTIKALKEAGLRDKVKIMVGGVPVTQAYADQIGADAYGETAVDAVMKAKKLINK
jgi:corrinoid protein of di/trimethylamine methyltransferase